MVHLCLLVQSVRFTVSVLPTEERALKMREGVVNGLVHDAAIGKGTPLVTAITPGAMLSDVALFIDSNKAALRPAASTEWGWCAARLLRMCMLGSRRPFAMQLSRGFPERVALHACHSKPWGWSAACAPARMAW